MKSWHRWAPAEWVEVLGLGSGFWTAIWTVPSCAAVDVPVAWSWLREAKVVASGTPPNMTLEPATKFWPATIIDLCPPEGRSDSRSRASAADFAASRNCRQKPTCRPYWWPAPLPHGGGDAPRSLVHPLRVDGADRGVSARRSIDRPGDRLVRSSGYRGRKLQTVACARRRAGRSDFHRVGGRARSSMQATAAAGQERTRNQKNHARQYRRMLRF
jgi:hypothetical protein